jgi:hypothetical protein
MVDLSGGQAGGLADRVKAVLTSPKETFTTLAAEPATPGELMMRWALPLAAIGPVASFIGGQVFGYGAFGFSYKPGLVSGLVTAVVSYVIGLVMIAVLALIADFLAPKFGGTADRTSAFKLAVYGATASWVGGIVGIWPALSMLGLLFGLYSLYLLYLGAKPFMKVPEDKALGFTALTILCAIVLSLVTAPVVAGITGLFGAGPAAMMANADTDAKVTIPGMGTIETDKIEAATKQMEAASNGQVKPVSSAELAALLPASFGAFTRTATESGSMGNMGSTAEATYTAGNKRFELKVVDMSALGAIAGLGAAIGVEQSREDANGFERTTTVNGQMQVEEWNKTSNSGKFGVMVANRFMIEAVGDANSIDDLKAAVAAVDQGKLEDLAG